MNGYAVRKKSIWFVPGSTSPYKLSRTRIDNFTKCQRCFWLEERYGVKKPDSYPLTLNIAVDALLKKEFDRYRAERTPHPLMETYGIDAVPFHHEALDSWRHNFVGVQYLDPETNFLVFGAVDDVWITSKKELLVVDYKATAKADTPTLDGDLGLQYKRQMEVYQWLLRQNGFPVSDTGYFVYVNGRKDAKAFDGKLEFDVTLLPCKGDATWIPSTLRNIKTCLESNTIPPSSVSCDYCGYRTAAHEALSTISPETLPKQKKSPKKKEEETAKLF